MFTQRGEVCNSSDIYSDIFSLGTNLDLSNCRLPYRKVWLFFSKMHLSSPGDHISVVFGIELPLKLIWLKVSSAFNLGQRQQWNFPSLSCGAWHQHLCGNFQQRSSRFTLVALVGWNQLRLGRTGLIESKCTWYKRKSHSLARTSALDFNKECCVIRIWVD